MRKLSPEAQLEAARNLTPDDCDIAAVGGPGRLERRLKLQKFQAAYAQNLELCDARAIDKAPRCRACGRRGGGHEIGCPRA